MKFKRGISLALALAIISGIGGPLDIRAAAADTGSSDALAALGIDTSIAPEGFDGAHIGGLGCGKQTEDDADDHGEDHGDEDGRDADG